MVSNRRSAPYTRIKVKKDAYFLLSLGFDKNDKKSVVLYSMLEETYNSKSRLHNDGPDDISLTTSSQSSCVKRPIKFCRPLFDCADSMPFLHFIPLLFRLKNT